MNGLFLKEKYNRDTFTDFLSQKFLPSDFEQSQTKIITTKDNKVIKDAIKLGICPSLELSIYEFRHNSKNDPRVMLSRESYNILSNNEIEPHALAVFFNEDNSQWRLSLITSDYILGKKKEQVKREFSNPRRFSYLLGEGCKLHTPESMLVTNGKVKSQEDLVSRFAIEVLTKEFYKKLFDWYDNWAIELVKYPIGIGKDVKLQKGEQNRIHLIRLITRFIFVWFIKQKGLIPDWIFNKIEVTKIFKKFKSDSLTDGNYYNGIIQNLFFATLNKQINEREFAYEKKTERIEDYGIKTKFRDKIDETIFAIPKEEFISKFESIPFLNGGLFECLDNFDTKEYIDGFSREKERQAFIPNALFWGKDDKIGLIELFNTYNFTIEENTPQDIDVALDPELLGKAFENLLGTFNQETQSTARNESGSFYTPREIVDYMVDTSLKEYLKEKLNPSESIEEKLNDLFSYNREGNNFTSEQTEMLMEAINNCKILDPACGSGAFPMGILNKLSFIMQKLDKNNEIWKQLQIKYATEKSKKAYGLDNKKKREERLKEIQDVFEISTGEYSNYARKLFLIENCIYGVDIQPIAIQICKLRFFISLIVDQKTDKNKENNYNVLPLPNLETKFVAANTLIGIKREAGFLADPDIEIKQKELLEIRHKHFAARDAKEKIELRRKDKNLCKDLVKLLKKDGFYNAKDAELLANWDPYDQSISSDFFDPYWMFGLSNENTSLNSTGCFDIVIGNPPYLKEGKISKSIFKQYKMLPYYQGKLDLWYMFACECLDFLKNNRFLCFIATNNWITSSGAKKLRNKVIIDTQIKHLVDFGNFLIFEKASIQTMIMLFFKNSNIDNYIFDLRRLTGNTKLTDVIDLLNKKINIKAQYLFPHIIRKNLINKLLTFSQNDVILDKISENCLYLSENEVANGIHPHYDFINKKLSIIYNLEIGTGIFGLSNKEKIELKLSKKEICLIKPYYTTKQIHKYYTDPENKLWIIYTDSNFKNPRSMDNYSNLKKHLDKFKKIITSDNKPYGLHRAREERFFKDEKIIVQRKCVGTPLFSYSDFDCYVSATFYIIKTSRFNIKYLIGLLNSKLIAFWLKNKGKMQGDNYQLDKEPLLQIPIFNANINQQKQIIKLVDQILSIKEKNILTDTDKIEQRIDKVIYGLYNFSKNEIEIIER